MVELLLEKMNFHNVINLSLDILSNSVNQYFTTKRIRDEILTKEFDYNPKGKDSSIEDLKLSLSHQLIPILSKLSKLGYIEKSNRKQWKKQKELDLTPNELIESLKHTKRRGKA